MSESNITNTIDSNDFFRELIGPEIDTTNPTISFVNDASDNPTTMMLREMHSYNQNMLAYHHTMRDMIRFCSVQQMRNERDRRYTHPVRRVTRDFSSELLASILLSGIPTTTNTQLLTQERINTLTRNFNYDSTTIVERTCPISLDEFTNGEELTQIIACSHIFKKEHLMNWFRRSTRCPVCRYNLMS